MREKHLSASRARPAATTTSASGSTPKIRRSSPLTADQGAVISVNARRNLEQLVQPANRAVLSRHHRQRGSPTGSMARSRKAARAATLSRSDYGEITFRDWHLLGVFEYGYIAVDPTTPNCLR